MSNGQEDSFKELEEENKRLQDKIQRLEIEVQVLTEFRQTTQKMFEEHLVKGFSEEMKQALKVSSLSRFK